MNTKRIDDTSHGLLLLQVSSLRRCTEKNELEASLRQLYTDYHELRQQLESVIRTYNQKARRIRQLAAWQDEGQKGGPMTLNTHITSPV